MTDRVAVELTAAWSVILRELRVFVSYRAQALSRLATIVLTLVLFHYISRLVHVARFPHPIEYFAFVIGGLVVLEIIESTLQMPALLYREMIAGTFERIVTSPFGAVPSMLAMTIFPVILAFVYGFATLLVAGLGFGMPLHWSTMALAFPVALLAAASFLPFSLVFAALTIAFKRQTGSAYVLTGLSFLSGLYFPTGLLPSWIRWASEIQPVTPSVDLLRNLVFGLALQGGATGDLLKMALFAFVLSPLAAGLLGIALQYSKRRGTLMEY